MVDSAPLFSEIAREFNEFVHGAIFAAHNVNFDYGFISMEYQRLVQSFRYPKICTCASMRRYYPGHKSYSLANLCQMYHISLETHHRALCDAKAAGHLLNLVNQKREEIAAWH
jgi:DNA polymerase-3 subunit epsilon